MSTVMELTDLGVKEEKAAPVAPPINLTERAAEEVRRILVEQNSPNKLYLRLRVVGEGCSGYKHKLDLDENVSPKTDQEFEIHGVAVVVDKRSLLYMDGVTVDYHEDLNRRGFSITNPNAKSTCGCGSSFSM